MPQEQTETFRLDASATITLGELAECCGISVDELDELMAYNALVPLESSGQELAFSAQWVVPLRKACKLRTDFDLDLFTVAILLENLNRIEFLERQVRSLQALVPVHLQSTRH
jgi:chaperone modulatory protein CbpM